MTTWTASANPTTRMPATSGSEAIEPWEAYAALICVGLLVLYYAYVYTRRPPDG